MESPSLVVMAHFLFGHLGVTAIVIHLDVFDSDHVRTDWLLLNSLLSRSSLVQQRLHALEHQIELFRCSSLALLFDESGALVEPLERLTVEETQSGGNVSECSLEVQSQKSGFVVKILSLNGDNLGDVGFTGLPDQLLLFLL